MTNAIPITSPAVKPIQGGGLLSAWRRSKNVTNETDETLERSASVLARAEGWCLIAVVAGLVVAAVLLGAQLANPDSLSPLGLRIGDLGATLLLALGVYWEFRFGRAASRCENEVHHRSRRRLADSIKLTGEAAERAATAHLETERLRALFSWRRLDSESAGALAEAIREIGTTGSVMFEYTLGDHESRHFARQLGDVFWYNGWHVAYRANTFDQDIPFWIHVPISSELAKDINRAFAKVGITQGPGDFPAPRQSFALVGGDMGSSSVAIFVGPKAMLEE